jgi:hypothetical protein
LLYGSEGLECAKTVENSNNMARIKHPKKHAWFTPSVSQMYVLAHAKKWPRQPVDFDRLNFMDEKNADHLFYPANLYSAGHAHLDTIKSNEREVMIQMRNREKTVLIGDSGGFQAATGVLDFDWTDPMGQKANDRRIELLRWLEHTADYSMVLDWPAWAIDTPLLPPTLRHYNPTTQPLERREDAFHNCLDGTIWNNHFFVKNRVPGATKFLNVLQGRTIEEAYEWYDAVTPFSSTEKYGERAFEGWALGGSTGGDPSLTMRLLIKLRDDGLLSGDDRWIHVLGRSRLSTAVYLSALNRALVDHVNENVQISYDAASAFLYAVNGNYVTDFALNPGQLNLISSEFPMHERYIGSKEPFIYGGVDAGYLNGTSESKNNPFPHFKSKIGDMLTMGDFILAPIEGKTKKAYRMDTASYYYIMAHNVEMQINAVEQSADMLYSEQAANHLPTIFLEFKDFVNRLFTTENPMALIESEASMFKDLISGERPGVNSIEDTSMFQFDPKPLNEMIAARADRKKKPVKIDTTPKMVDEHGLFGFDKQANG